MTPIYGARLTDHTPPNGAYYAVAGAPLDGAGTLRHPCGDPQLLMNGAPAGATFVLDGTFPASLVQQWRRPITLQAAPGRQAILLGSDPATQWTPEGGLWWHVCPIFDHTPEGDILDPARPWASWPEQVWMDGEPLVMVGPGMDVNPGEFTVMSGGLLWIADDPAEHDMRIAVRRTAFSGSLDMQTGVHPPAVLLGIEAWDYATESRDRAAIKVYGTSHVEDVTVLDCSAGGISVMRSQGATVRNCTVTGGGQLGVQAYLADDLELGWNLVEGCNRKGFSFIGSAGAVKLFQSVRARAHHNRLLPNNGHGLWWDTDSDDARFWRNHITGCRTGIFYELCRDGLITGNRATDCIAGVLLSGSSDTAIEHNTMTGNTNDIRVQIDHRRPVDTASIRITGNVTTGSSQPPVSPSLLAAGLLELSLAETAQPHTGWYGPVYTPPEPPPTEPPMPYDLGPYDEASDALCAEVRRLEALIANDDHLATIAQLEADLHTTAVALMGSAQQVNTLTATVAGQQVTIANLSDTIVDQSTAITDQAAQIISLAAQLAECEGNCPPPDPPSLIIGGSDKLGYPDLKTRLTGVLPGSFTHFIAGARFTAAEETKMATYVADGVIPSLSFAVGTQADTDYNMGRLIANGWDILRGGYCIGNEPTQKTPTAAQWRAANQYAASVLPSSWTLVLGPFQRVDIHAAQADPRFIGNWIGPDVSWVVNAANVALGVNVYDKNHSVAQTFEQLVTVVGDSGYSVESYAFLLGVKVWVREAGAPEAQAGEWVRPAGWKPQWYQDMWEYASGLLDIYEVINVFNSDVGGDPPPEGWWAWTTPSSLAAYRAIIEASQS